MALSVTSAPWHQVAMPALDLRRYLTALVSSEGVATAADMTVSQRGAGANMSVDIAAGYALVQGDTVAGQGMYLAYNDAVYNLTGFTAAHATLPRIDRVAIRVRDIFHGDAANDEAFVILTGTATSGATLANLTGAAAIPGSHLLRANVLVPATATTITTANIMQGPVVTTAGPTSRTGIIPAAGTTATAGTGFTYTHTNGTGVYVFTFTTPFAATPVVVATPTSAVSISGQPIIGLSAVSTSGFTATIADRLGAVTDQSFNFLAAPVV
jgi:hypothetical protein